MSKQAKGRGANSWPLWKLRMYLPDSRRWTALRLVQLAERDRPWQFQLLDGKPAGVGLFASREWAMAWAKTHCERVLDDPPTEAIA